MLTTALAFGVPGCLAALASCASQSQAQSQALAQAQSRAQTQGQARSQAVARKERKDRKDRKTKPESSQKAVLLLGQAAQQGVRQTYLGEEEVVWDNGGVTALDSTVYHRSGGPTFTQTEATGSNQPIVSPDLDGQSPEGVLGITRPLVQLLETNYVLSYAGGAAVDNRQAEVVRASRTNGTVAAEFLLDTATKLPLERKVYDGSSQLISWGTFSIGQVGGSAQVPAFAVAAQQPSTTVVWSYPMPPTRLRTFAQQGWVVPATLPGGLTLFTGGETDTSTGTVLDLAYSDGLYVVSVFEQRGKLATTLAGWQKTTVAGQAVYAAVPDRRSFTWSGHDVVYTLIADAPSQTVADVVGKLPHDQPPGFWKRISRGLSRIVHLVNPFG